MSSIQLKDALISSLEELDICIIKSSELLNVRCPICGDSSKNAHSAHMYIKIPQDERSPIVYQCFRADCQSSGVFSNKIYKMMDVYDPEIGKEINRYNSSCLQNSQYRISRNYNKSVSDWTIPKTREIPLHEKKRDYLNWRLGLNLSYEDMEKLKVVFNIGDFVLQNNIRKITVKKYFAKQLFEDFIGFITTGNDFINFRNVSGLIRDPNTNTIVKQNLPEKAMRYYKYKIFKGMDRGLKFYTIPNEIDVLTTDEITINIAEGIIDILGVYHHVFQQEKKNTLYAAANGAHFGSVLMYFIEKGIIGERVTVNLFSDNNVTLAMHRKAMSDMVNWVGRINVVYNTILDEKGKSDYGVPANQIHCEMHNLYGKRW